ncbi:glycosyltransferase family 4 protein [Thalassotalea litorea]|uniref:glycosyltransferase family 4 protein n=1 Tax=Thalassotalea litorea TaxID=2020715 RepID=UPI0037367113
MNRLAFFDFVTTLGGANLGSISLCQGLSRDNKVTLIDAYGSCREYIKRVEGTGTNFIVLNQHSNWLVIGGKRGLRIKNFLLQLPELLRVLLRLRKGLQNNNIQLVWVNNKKSLAFVSLASLLTDTRVVLYYRGEGKKKEFDVAFRLLVKLFCDGLISHASTANSTFNEIFSSKKICHVPNSVTIDSKVKIQPCTSKFKGNYTNIVLPAGRPVLEKGHMTALKALKIIREVGVDVKLIFPGEIPYGVSSEFVSSLQMYIAENNLIDNVSFIGWRNDLQQIIADSDIVILPSHTEGFPRVLIESMLLNTLVIATPVGGVPEAILHNETGFIIPIDDEEKLARLIIYAIKNNKEVNDIQVKAKQFALNKFSQDKQISKISQLFSEILGT